MQSTLIREPRSESLSPAPVLVVSAVAPELPRDLVDIVEEWGLQSFPASDPPSNW